MSELPSLSLALPSSPRHWLQAHPTARSARDGFYSLLTLSIHMLGLWPDDKRPAGGCALHLTAMRRQLSRLRA